MSRPARCVFVDFIRSGWQLFGGKPGVDFRLQVNDHSVGTVESCCIPRLAGGWGAKDGVAVEKNNQLIANLECQDVPVSKLSEEQKGVKSKKGSGRESRKIDVYCGV